MTPDGEEANVLSTHPPDRIPAVEGSGSRENEPPTEGVLPAGQREVNVSLTLRLPADANLDRLQGQPTIEGLHSRAVAMYLFSDIHWRAPEKYEIFPRTKADVELERETAEGARQLVGAAEPVHFARVEVQGRVTKRYKIRQLRNDVGMPYEAEIAMISYPHPTAPRWILTKSSDDREELVRECKAIQDAGYVWALGEQLSYLDGPCVHLVFVREWKAVRAEPDQGE